MVPEILLPGQVPPNFVIQEFVSPQIFRSRGLQSIQHTTPFQLNFAHRLRVISGTSVQINNYHAGGPRVASGTRDRGQLPPGGGTLSMHYLALALDVQLSGISPQQVHEMLNDNFHLFWEIGLTTLESLAYTAKGGRIGWTHGDGRTYDSPTMIRLEREKRFAIVEP